MTLTLEKHTLNDTPPADTPLLLLLKIYNNYVWTVGFWTEYGFDCAYDDGIHYAVVNWYKLPKSNIIDSEYSKYQQKMEDFWYDA